MSISVKHEECHSRDTARMFNEKHKKNILVHVTVLCSCFSYTSLFIAPGNIHCAIVLCRCEEYVTLDLGIVRLIGFKECIFPIYVHVFLNFTNLVSNIPVLYTFYLVHFRSFVNNSYRFLRFICGQVYQYIVG